MSRSTRQRKPVNYRKLLDDESDNSDDDFASSPPSKKPRGGDSSGKSRGKDAQMKCTTVKEIPKKQARLSRDEKQFSKQLEQALAASKKESSASANINSVNSEPIPSDTLDTPSVNTSSTMCTTERSKDGDFVPDESVSFDESEEESYSGVEEDEDSDFSVSPQPKKAKRKNMKENVKSTPKVKQTKAKKATTKPNMSVDKLSTNSLPKKMSKPPTVKVTPAKKPIVQKSTPSLTACAPSLKIDSSDSDNAKVSKSSPASVKCDLERGNPGVLGVNKKVMNWTPPAKVGQKTAAASSKPTHMRSGLGGTPVIRVGLSRNARVKSLHTNIKI